MNTQLLQLKADTLKALAHPTRLAVVELLAQGERCVCELVAAIDVEQANLSQHLSLLRRLGIVDSTKDGVRVMYRLCCPQTLLIGALAGDIVADRVTQGHPFPGSPEEGED